MGYCRFLIQQKNIVQLRPYCVEKAFKVFQGREVMNLKVVLEQDEDGISVATCPSLPGCISQGKTEEEALSNIKEAIVLHLECLSEDGIPIKKESKRKEIMVSVTL